MRKLFIRLMFTKLERELISNAVSDYTDYPDDVRAEHVGEDWFENQEAAAFHICNLMS